MFVKYPKSFIPHEFYTGKVREITWNMQKKKKKKKKDTIERKEKKRKEKKRKEKKRKENGPRPSTWEQYYHLHDTVSIDCTCRILYLY